MAGIESEKAYAKAVGLTDDRRKDPVDPDL